MLHDVDTIRKRQKEKDRLSYCDKHKYSVTIEPISRLSCDRCPFYDSDPRIFIYLSLSLLCVCICLFRNQDQMYNYTRSLCLSHSFCAKFKPHDSRINYNSKNIRQQIKLCRYTAKKKKKLVYTQQINYPCGTERFSLCSRLSLFFRIRTMATLRIRKKKVHSALVCV